MCKLLPIIDRTIKYILQLVLWGNESVDTSGDILRKFNWKMKLPISKTVKN